MKANKALRRLAKIEALLADIKARTSGKTSDIRQALQDAGAAVARVKEIVSSQVAAKAGTGAKKAPPARKKIAVKKAAVSAKISKPEKKRALRKKIVKEKAAAMTPSVSAPISPVVSGTNIGDVG